MAELSVRSVLVTGANRGLGLGFVQHFLKMPNPPQWIFATCWDPKGQRAQDLQNLVPKHPNLIIITLEIANPASIKAAAAKVEEHLGGSGLNLLINNAGMVKPKTLEEETLEDLTETYTTNTVGPLLMGQELQNLASKHPNIIIIPLEVSDPASIKAAAAKVEEHLGGSGLNLLINNAGIAKPSSLDNETPENMIEVYTTNTVGPLLMGQAFLPLLKKAAQGSPGSGLSCSKAAVVNMSSIAGCITSFIGWESVQCVSYRCSKAALNMLSKCQSLAYKEQGILCVALHPGWVQTDMGSSAGQVPPLTVDNSVQGMLKVLSSLSEKNTGAYLDWEGNVIPW